MSAGPAPLAGTRVLTLAVNVPGPAAAARLREFGASVTKVEPPGGDPLRHFNPAWYEVLAAGQKVLALDLKKTEDREELFGLLAQTDLLLTSSRPAALDRLGLGWERLRKEHPRLSQVAIVGHPSPRENEPGHDLTYLAGWGMLTPPEMPRTLLADLAGAERAASAALGLLLARERGAGPGYAEVALSEAAETFAAPLRYGLSAPGGLLGGGLPGYNLYRASEGWVAVAALEPHFLKRLASELGFEEVTGEVLREVFAGKPAVWWEEWAARRDIPLAALKEPEEPADGKE